MTVVGADGHRRIGPVTEGRRRCPGRAPGATSFKEEGDEHESSGARGTPEHQRKCTEWETGFMHLDIPELELSPEKGVIGMCVVTERMGVDIQGDFSRRFWG